ncbi:myotubularin-related protein DDB_G0290005-like [Palaemon carinicauda]|uniref:myotubularin-related protein DDB_G0290005-like n=1 Tax=Palaemon carinicauda TaxID=392227 RepID=UPI0035B5B393
MEDFEEEFAINKDVKKDVREEDEEAAEVESHVQINLVGTIPAVENRSSEIKTSSLKHEFTADYPKDTVSEVYSNATVTSIMDNIGFAAASVSPATTIMTARPTYATNTATITTPTAATTATPPPTAATTATPYPTAATTTTTTNDEVDCSILTGNDNLQKPEIQYETIQLGLHEEGEPTFTTLKSNESTSSLQRKKKNQCALIKKQRMQICRLMKKFEQMKELTYLALGICLMVCIIFNFDLTYKCMNISACLHT